VLVVGFDTATPAVSVALHDGERVISEAFALDARRHGELLTPMVAKVMADAGVARSDLTGVAVGVGPGPYTGLRVGVVTARVLGAVLGLPVYGVCSLDILAAAAAAVGTEFLVATDARRREVYWARYDASGRRLEGPAVGRADSIPGARELPVAGAGGPLYPEAFGPLIAPLYPDARTLCEIVAVRPPGSVPSGPVPSGTVLPGTVLPGTVLPGTVLPGTVLPGAVLPGAAGPLLPAEPLYLRRPDAREPGPPKRVTPP
jgi:tRNA threonylcarbamoyladenosine biosynthesis protein TsaB